MWVFTQGGFYSAVEYEPRWDPKKPSQRLKDLKEQGPYPLLLVRTRDEGDMKRLIARIPEATYITTNNADYRFRTILSVAEWTDFLAIESAQIDYANFKNRVTKTLGMQRHNLLSRVWGVMMELQDVGKYVYTGSRRKVSSKPKKKVATK
jgi:hypothetical protein